MIKVTIIETFNLIEIWADLKIVHFEPKVIFDEKHDSQIVILHLTP